jgi:hypothetical protein
VTEQHTVAVWKLIQAKEIAVRATDESLNSQPAERTWYRAVVRNAQLCCLCF